MAASARRYQAGYTQSFLMFSIRRQYGFSARADGSSVQIMETAGLDDQDQRQEETGKFEA